MNAASRNIEPPEQVTLTYDERVCFDEIIAELPKLEWSAHQVTVAALLAKEVQALCREQALLRQEGSVLVNSRGNPVLNPRARVVQQLTATILSMRRSLSLHARGKHGGDNREIGRRREIQKGNEHLLDDDDDLIARPKVH